MQIVVFGRKADKNLGDMVIADCLKYLLERESNAMGIKVDVKIMDVREKNEKKLINTFKNTDAAVFPGGGLNSAVMGNYVKRLAKLANDVNEVPFFVQGIGINRVKRRDDYEKCLIDLFSCPNIRQVTTRGDYHTMMELLPREMEYTPKQVLDAGNWSGEAYGIKKKDSDVIGVGIIHPEVFKKYGLDLEPEEVTEIYINIVKELEHRGYKWELFLNGRLKVEGIFALQILKKSGLIKHRVRGFYLTRKNLIKTISSYKGVIAARMHANIIATSMGIPSVGLVWNDKMNMYAEQLGVEDRYIQYDKLKDTASIVDIMEKAIDEGYDAQKIEQWKDITMNSIRNIILSAQKKADSKR